MVGGLLLILATSLDGFAAGVSYGFRGIRFPARERLLVTGISVATLGLAMLAGHLAGRPIPGRWARCLGGWLLAGLGLWSAAKGLLQGSPPPAAGRLWTWRVPSLGLVVQILREPARADLDASGGINGPEALWLGLALAMDALGAGFCATLGNGLPICLPVAAGAVNWLLLTAGLAFVRRWGRERLPAMAVLAALGFLRLF